MNRIRISTSRRVWAVAALAPLVLGGSVLAAASAQAASAPGQQQAVKVPHVVTHSISIAAQHATLKYWTRRRLETARPVNIVLRHPRRGHAHNPSGKPTLLKGGMPVAGIAGAGRTGITPAYPFSYTSFNVPVALYTTWPYEVNGRIFFTNHGGNYSCSGTSVASYHGPKLEDEVWTAGHCVANTDQRSQAWDSNAIFIPAYNGAVADYAPFGEFVATRLATVNVWLSNGDVSLDEGAMEVGGSATGPSLGQLVGYDGFAWNWPDNERFTAFGYPGAAPYTGNFMIEDQASTGTTVSWSGQAGPPQIGIGNPMTEGASGGAWDISWGRGSVGYIDGHNDYKLGGQPLAVYSPYQDNLTNAVRCFGIHNPPAGCCGTRPVHQTPVRGHRGGGRGPACARRSCGSAAPDDAGPVMLDHGRVTDLDALAARRPVKEY